MSLRLLFVVNNPDFFISHRLPLGLQALREGYEVHIATPDGAGVEELLRCGFVHHLIPMTRSGSHLLQEMRTVGALIKLYRRLQPDIVHHVTVKPVLYGTFAARWARVPGVVNAFSGLGYVFVRRGGRAKLLRNLVALAYRFSLRHPRQLAIFQNHDDMGQAEASRWIRSGESVLIRGSGVDLDLFRAEGEPGGPLLVVLPARMLWDKGIREFVEAARLLRSQGVVARFALVGGHDSGNPASASQQWLEGCLEEGVVEWWGQQGDMHVVFSQAHVVCLPSYREGLPKALLEAAASGKPIVTTDVTGCREVIVHGEGGLLVPAGDAVALASALRRLLEDGDMRREMGRRNRLKAEQVYGIDRIVRETFAVYERLHAHSRTRP